MQRRLTLGLSEGKTAFREGKDDVSLRKDRTHHVRCESIIRARRGIRAEHRARIAFTRPRRALSIAAPGVLGLYNTVAKEFTDPLPVDFGLVEMFNHPRNLGMLFFPMLNGRAMSHTSADFTVEALNPKVSRSEFIQELPICKLLKLFVAGKVWSRHSSSLEDRGDSDKDSRDHHEETCLSLIHI